MYWMKSRKLNKPFRLLSKILLVVVFSFTSLISVYASDFSSYEVKEFSNNTVVSGTLPTVTTSNASLTKLINTEIKNIYTARSNSAKNSNAKSISFSYEVYDSNGVESIVIKSKVSKLKTVSYVNTIVFDKNKIYTLDTYLSSSDLKVFNKLINDTIKQSPQNYKVSEVNLSDKTAFYVKDGVTYAAFDGETITTSTDITSIAYKSTNLNTYTLKKSDYYVQSSTSTKYVPIRDVYTSLGYRVTYKNKQIFVSDTSGKRVATFDTDSTPKPSVNGLSSATYYSPTKALIYNNVAYCPLSLVASTTNTVYDIKSNGDIEFTITK